MNNISPEIVVVGGIGLLILAAIILAKWGKQILTVLLVVAGLVVAGALFYGWTQVQKPDLIPSDTRETVGDVADIARALKPNAQPEVQYVPQPTYNAGGGFGWFCAGALAVAFLGAVCFVAYLYVRFKLLPQKLGQPKAKKQVQDVPVIYITGDDDDDYDDAPITFDEQWLGTLLQ